MSHKISIYSISKILIRYKDQPLISKVECGKEHQINLN